MRRMGAPRQLHVRERAQTQRKASAAGATALKLLYCGYSMAHAGISPVR